MANDQVLRTGVLFKKGSGQGPFGRRNWKPRYFILTPAKLTYYTYEDGDLKGEIDLTRCNEQSLEVMPTDSMKTGSSASTIWRVAINSPDRRLLIAANTEVEMNSWVEQFRIAFAINSGHPMPAAVQRQSYSQAPGAVTSTGAPEGTAGIIDFQNFAAARRSVGGAMRASAGQYPGHEFRLSDDLIRHQQAEHERLEMERKQQELEAARLREEEIRRLEMLKGEQTTSQSTGADVEEEVRREQALEAQRQQRREEHERERYQRELVMGLQDQQQGDAAQPAVQGDAAQPAVQGDAAHPAVQGEVQIDGPMTPPKSPAADVEISRERPVQQQQQQQQPQPNDPTKSMTPPPLAPLTSFEM